MEPLGVLGPLSPAKSNEGWRRREPALLLLPGTIVLLAAFVLPILQVLAYSIFTGGVPGVENFSTAPWRRLFEDSYHLMVAERTIRLGLVVTAVTLLLGYPLGLVIEAVSPRVRALLLLVLILPLMTSVVVRTFGWLVILGRGGPIVRTLREWGWVPGNFQISYTETGIVIAMVQVLLPYMVLTLIGVLGQMDRRLVEAARTMGADWFTTLRTVVWPLSLPGVIAGSVLVFAITVSSFITPVLIGGLKLPVLAAGVYHAAIAYNDWPLAAAQAVALFAVVAVVLLPMALGQRARAR